MSARATSTQSPVRFDEAWQSAITLVRERLGSAAPDVVLVRDLLGRIRLVLDDRESSGVVDPKKLEALVAELHPVLGAFSPGAETLLMRASTMFAPEEIFDSEDIYQPETEQGPKLLDRSVIGADWTRPSLREPRNARISLFGIKGGVGRSTAAAALAWRLASKGRRVLIFDLDLESPGVSSTLLPPESHPEFGAVDWFVESAVRQADRELLVDSVGRSPLGAGGGANGTGEVLVIPAGGRRREGYEYLPKLARTYMDLAVDGTTQSFGDRLEDFVHVFEDHVQPDVTLLDSRAGLHDIAAVVVTRLHATSLLFAIDSSQTWAAYETLFQTWHAHMGRARGLRADLQMIAAQVPETGTRRYLDSFLERSYQLFMDNFYDEVLPAGADTAESDELFSYDIRDPDASHFPVRINWSRALQQFEPVREPDTLIPEQVDAAFGELFRWVEAVISRAEEA